jgi:hypothetical protein
MEHLPNYMELSNELVCAKHDLRVAEEKLTTLEVHIDQLQDALDRAELRYQTRLQERVDLISTLEMASDTLYCAHWAFKPSDWRGGTCEKTSEKIKSYIRELRCLEV